MLAVLLHLKIVKKLKFTVQITDTAIQLVYLERYAYFNRNTCFLLWLSNGKYLVFRSLRKIISIIVLTIDLLLSCTVP